VTQAHTNEYTVGLL